MKISNKIVCLAVGMTLSLGAFAKTDNGSGVRGGGHVLDVDSTPYLMDLASKAVCDWKKGEELIEELPALRETLKQLDHLDWYFSADLKEEISHLNFCMTGPLYTVSAYDWNSVVAKPVKERPRQAGYRYYDSAFIDTDIFDRMNEVNKAMLVIHETMHSYLYMETNDRSLKLRSMVKVLDKVRAGQVATREKLHYAMSMNEIIFPLTVGQLENGRNSVAFLKASIKVQSEMILKTKKLDELVSLTSHQAESLSSWDYFFLGREYQRINILEEAIVVTLRSLSAQEIKNFLKERELQRISLIKVALNHLYTFSEEQKKVILSSEKVNEMLTSGFDELLNEKFESRELLIISSVKFQRLVTGAGVEEAALVSLEKAVEFPTKLKWIVEAIIILHDNNALEAITSNEKFYSALGLKNQKEQVKTMALKIERERKVALESLNKLSAAMIATFKDQLHDRVDDETFNKIITQIDFTKF